MSQSPHDAGQDVNDATPTNDPEPTPAETELGGDPDDRGKTTQTGSEDDVPEPLRTRLREATGRDKDET